MTFLGIIVGLLVLGLMMTVHELGHYLMGRKLGFKILEFQIFMGPRLFTWEKQGIKYSLRLLPIGAAVQFAGEFPEADDELQPGDFYERPKRYRAAVLAAGPLVNILTGIFAFYLLFLFSGYATPTLRQVQPDSLAAEAGLTAGDRITSFAGHPVRTDLDLQTEIMIAPLGEKVPLTYVDDATGETVETSWQADTYTGYFLGVTIDGTSQDIIVRSTNPSVNPYAEKLQAGDVILAIDDQAVDAESLSQILSEYKDQSFDLTIRRDGRTSTVRMSAAPDEVLRPSGIVLTLEKDGLRAIPYAFHYGWSMIKSNVKLLGQVFKGTIKAKDSLAGPVGIVQMFTGVVADEGLHIGARLLQLLSLFGLISIALGFTNLLPIPPLDGNQLLLTGVEAIRGKRLSPKVQSVVTMIGVVLILGLAALALFFDVSRMIGG